MIAVDTNVVLRQLLEDDALQVEKARRLFEGGQDVLITDIVLAETVWTLCGKKYRATPDDVVAVVGALLEEKNVVFESRAAVWAALDDFGAAKPIGTANGTRRADFADALIVRKAGVTAARMNRPFHGAFTFDRAALALPGMRSA